MRSRGKEGMRSAPATWHSVASGPPHTPRARIAAATRTDRTAPHGWRAHARREGRATHQLDGVRVRVRLNEDERLVGRVLRRVLKRVAAELLRHLERLRELHTHKERRRRGQSARPVGEPTRQGPAHGWRAARVAGGTRRIGGGARCGGARCGWTASRRRRGARR
eukprot:6651099-Prymnesium_polylepis.1